MFEYIGGTPIWATLAERSNLSNLFIVIVSLDWTYLLIIMTMASPVFKKSSFHKNSHLNALESKFGLDVMKVNVNLGPSFEQTW